MLSPVLAAVTVHLVVTFLCLSLMANAVEIVLIIMYLLPVQPLW